MANRGWQIAAMSMWEFKWGRASLAVVALGFELPPRRLDETENCLRALLGALRAQAEVDPSGLSREFSHKKFHFADEGGRDTDRKPTASGELW